LRRGDRCVHDGGLPVYRVGFNALRCFPRKTLLPECADAGLAAR